MYRQAVAVTPSDATVVRHRALFVGGAGNVSVIPLGQTASVTFTAVNAGTTIELAVSKVLATGTTATNIVGLS